MMAGWDYLINRKDLRATEVRAANPAGALAEGEVIVQVERFAMTANNITYGAFGDMMGYWNFFPAPDGLGRIPVWGFATVTDSQVADVPVGLRLFGYLPMSTHYRMKLVKTRHGYVDTAAHRAALPPTYNAYNEAPVEASDDFRALLRPLLMTSFLLDDFLSDDANLTSLVLTSASSKTALGLAWFARRRGMKVVGLTSASNRADLASTGVYDQLLTYDEVGTLKAEGAIALVDFAGNRATIGAVHATLGTSLTRSLIVGGTHWNAERVEGQLTGVTPVMFFAPDQIRKRSAEWGQGVLDERFSAALATFIADNGWLNLVHHQGPEGLATAYHAVLEGKTRMQDGHIIHPA